MDAGRGAPVSPLESRNKLGRTVGADERLLCEFEPPLEGWPVGQLDHLTRELFMSAADERRRKRGVDLVPEQPVPSPLVDPLATPPLDVGFESEDEIRVLPLTGAK